MRPRAPASGAVNRPAFGLAGGFAEGVKSLVVVDQRVVFGGFDERDVHLGGFWFRYVAEE